METELVPIKTVKVSNSLAGVSVRGPKPEKGIEFARFAMALGAAKGDLIQALEIAKNRYSDSPQVITAIKGAVAAGTTTGETWAAPLVDSYQNFAGDFVEFLRPQTIIGKFGRNGIPGLRKIPFNVSIPTQTSAGEGWWIGEGKAKPVTKFDFARETLGFAKVANIAVITEELARFSNPDAEAIVRDQLAAALISRLDTDFVNPAKAAVAGVSPASITNGVTAIPSGGSDAEAIREDIKAIFSTYIAANIAPTSAVWIMPSVVALCLSLMRNMLGQKEFPEISMFGGSFEGLPVIVSDFVEPGTVILANASDIWLADDGQIEIDASREASLEMSDSPVGDASTPTGATSMVSLWQSNSIGYRCERFINWKKRRPQAVAMLSGVAWGGAISS
jgi:hypothetical protein